MLTTLIMKGAAISKGDLRSDYGGHWAAGKIPDSCLYGAFFSFFDLNRLFRGCNLYLILNSTNWRIERVDNKAQRHWLISCRIHPRRLKIHCMVYLMCASSPCSLYGSAAQRVHYMSLMSRECSRDRNYTQ